MTASAFSGLRVVEVAGGIPGAYCGKLLADLGALVVKVEPPGGDPARGHDGSFTPRFLYLNTSKLGVAFDLAGADGTAKLRTLLERADVLIDDHPAAHLERAGFGWEALTELNPRLVSTSITPYGRSGPRAGAPGGELTLVHASGLGNLLPTRSRDTTRAPVKLGGHPLSCVGGVVAALATIAAVLGRERTGRGELVEVALQEVALALVAPVLAGHRYQGSSWSRVPDRPPAMGRMQTADGYVILNAFDDHHFDAFRELMGNPDWCAGEQWSSMAYRAQHLMDIAEHLDAWTATQKKDELHHRAARRGIPIGAIADAREVLANPQYAARGYFALVEHPEAGSLRYPGAPYQLSATPARVSRPAPRLGEHTEQVLRAAAAPPSESDARDDAAGAGGTTSPAPRLPLEGFRVLDFCWVWAGPYAGSLLGALGAEVIKVEGPGRLDLTRRSVVWPLPEPAPRELGPNEGMAYNAVNLNKKSLTLDLRHAEGVSLAQRLAAQCDVVVDNMRPGALEKLGLGYQDLRRLRADVIVASSSGRGFTGPERDYLGFASVHQGIGGSAFLTGYPDDHPCHSGGDIDLLNAMTLAFAITAALHHRARTGEGQFIDYSQCAGVTALLGSELLAFQLTGEVPQRMGNNDPSLAPHNVYRAWGVDHWIAIEVHDDREFAVLAAAVGRGELAADPRFATMAARKANERELDAILEGWTCQRDRDGMVGELARAGLRVAPSRDGRDLYADRHLVERGAFWRIDHPELGPLELVAPPFRLASVALAARRAPMLGEHTDEVLASLLEMRDSDLAALRQRGVIL